MESVFDLNRRANRKELFQYFVDNKNDSRYEHCERTKRCIDFIEPRHLCTEHNNKIPNVVANMSYRVVHVYNDYDKFEKIAAGQDQKFITTLDYVITLLLDRMIGFMDIRMYYKIKFIIANPERESIDIVFERGTYALDSVRKELIKKDLLFNLLATDTVEVKLTIRRDDTFGCDRYNIYDADSYSCIGDKHLSPYKYDYD